MARDEKYYLNCLRNHYKSYTRRAGSKWLAGLIAAKIAISKQAASRLKVRNSLVVWIEVRIN